MRLITNLQIFLVISSIILHIINILLPTSKSLSLFFSVRWLLIFSRFLSGKIPFRRERLFHLSLNIRIPTSIRICLLYRTQYPYKFSLYGRFLGRNNFFLFWITAKFASIPMYVEKLIFIVKTKRAKRDKPLRDVVF